MYSTSNLNGYFEIQPLMDEMHSRSTLFHTESVKGKKLYHLKPLADKTKERMYESLEYFLKNRTPELLIKTLEALRNLGLIYSEMEKQEKRLIIRAIRKIGANPKTSIVATVATVLLGGYIVIIFGIADDLNSPRTRRALVISGVVAVIISVFATFIITYLEKKYSKVKIHKGDLIEKRFLTRYFKLYGQMQFAQCIELIDNLRFEHEIEIPYKCRMGLKRLAEDSLKYQESHPLRGENAKKYAHLPNQKSFGDSEKHQTKNEKKRFYQIWKKPTSKQTISNSIEELSTVPNVDVEQESISINLTEIKNSDEFKEEETEINEHFSHYPLPSQISLISIFSFEDTDDEKPQSSDNES